VRQVLLVAILLSMPPAVTFLAAQEVRDSSSLAFPILSVGVGARATAMGECYVAEAADATAVFWNPAGLALISQHQAVFSHHSYIQDSRYETLCYARPVGAASGLGLSFSFLDYGEFEERDSTGTLQGEYHPNDVGLGLAYGIPMSRKWSAGFRTSWMRQSILDVAHNALVWDAGLLGRPSRQFHMGLNVKSMGVDSKGGRLPLEAKTGVSYRIQVGDAGQHTLTYAGGADYRPDSVSRANLGFEGCFNGRYCGRAGSIIDFGRSTQDWKKGLSLGAGMRFEAIQLDYAFTFGGGLGDSHRISLTGSWGSRGKPVTLPEPDREADDIPSPLPGPPAKPVTITFELPGQACGNPSDCFDKAVALENKGKKLEAMRYYLKAIEYDPKLEAVWLRLGRLYYSLGREAFEKALEANPGNQALRQWLQLQP
jgi:hypothetical protein